MNNALVGWGRTSPAIATLHTPGSEADVVRELALGETLISRGLGRSYGDAAQLSGGVVVSNRGLGGIGPIDADGVVTVGAGVSIDELLNVSLPQGWFVPVTAGTRQITVGGAIAADVHGKNHHVDGSFGLHVRSMRLVTPLGVVNISQDEDSELFWATIGAMGLTGIVTSVTIEMIKVETNKMLVDTDRFDSLDDVMVAMRSGDDRYRYSVAWVDCMTRGRRMGRAILTRANHALSGDVENPSLEPPKASRLSIPFAAPSGLLNRASVRAFNELWFRSAPRHEVAELTDLATFFHPLDGVDKWNLLYGRRGFVQYQFCVPDEASDVIREVIDQLSTSHLPSFLAVLKRFGPANPSPLSFPIEGWTLALDLPLGPKALPGTLDELDVIVANAGGRVYLAKDARLAPEHVHAMYPRVNEFLRVKSRVDPNNQITSDLARRLHLVGT